MAQDPKVLIESDNIQANLNSGQGLFASPPGGAAETNYLLHTSFVTLPNKLVFAKASANGASARVFKVGESVSYKIVNWTATRVGCPPLSPDVEEDDTWTLLHNQVSGVSPGVGPDTISKRYSVEGTYVYVRSTAYGTSDSRVMGVPPIYTYSQESATLDPEDFTAITEEG